MTLSPNSGNKETATNPAAAAAGIASRDTTKRQRECGRGAGDGAAVNGEFNPIDGTRAAPVACALTDAGTVGAGIVRDPKMPAGAGLSLLWDAAFSATLKSAIDCWRRL